ncbi:MAG: hypothetical protein KBT33_05330 [Prevotellaceae bacterium]|nr:hypothetical protein [Candidatus Minthosoma equi]
MKKLYKASLTLALALISMVANAQGTTVYSWEGNGVTNGDEFAAVGGTATAMGGDANVVAGAKQKNNWCFKLGKTYEVKDADGNSIKTHYVEITLDNALKGGEEIAFNTFITSEGKSAIFGIDFDGENALQYDVVDLLTANGIPTTEGKLTVPAEAAGCSKIRLFRKSGGTSVFVSKLIITSAGEAPAAKASLTDMSLSVAEGEQIDEDGDFKVTFNYKGTVLDESVMAAGSLKITVLDATGAAIVEGEPWTFSFSAGSKNIYVSDLEGGKEYTLKIDEITIKDNSKIDYETVFEGEEILKITEGLPTVKFTPVAPEVQPVEIKNMSVTCDKNSLIDEEGDYTVTFKYTGKINDENINAEDLFAQIKYQVYDENFNFITSGDRDFNLEESSRNVYVSDLKAGQTYIFMVTGLVVMGNAGEVLNLTDGLPKLTFKVKDPDAPQAISMSEMSFTVVEGEEIDDEGDFKITFNYTATVNDASAVNYPFATVDLTVYDANGEKVAGNVADFNCDAASKNFYISNLEAGKTYTIVANKIEIQDFMTMEMLCELSKDLPTLTFTTGGATGISNVNVNSAKAGKFMENGKVVIYKNGQKFNMAGQLVK